MSVSSCPSPDILNPLRVNGFKFNIAKLPEITYFISRCEIPTIGLASAGMDTPLSTLKFAGDKISYGTYTVEFQVDEEMRNWNMVYFWLIGLGFPEDNEQYMKWLNLDRNEIANREVTKHFSDAYLTPLSGSMQPLQQFTFIDMFPTSLSGPSFDSTNASNSIALATATFEYSYITTSMKWPT